MNIFRRIKEKISFARKEDKPRKLDTPIDDLEQYEEIQAFVYKDLDLLKKKSNYLSNIKNNSLPQEVEDKIYKNKIELSRTLDNLIRNKTTIEQEMNKFEDFKKQVNKELEKLEKDREYPDSSPIPRHLRTPKQNPHEF